MIGPRQPQHERPRHRLVFPWGLFNPQNLLGFVQWDSFVQDWRRLGLGDDELRALEAAIMAEPKRAPVIAGTGGVRKLRFAPPRWQSGKSGAVRVGYVYFEKHAIALLLVAYAKNEQDDISSSGRQAMRQLVNEIEMYLNRRSHHGQA